MGKPYDHAKTSAKKFGGNPEDYLAIHELMDSSRAVMGDVRHRALTHNTWFVTTIVTRVYGQTITNSDDQVISVQDICEEHILEDYGRRFIPTAQDFLEQIPLHDWMDNGRGDDMPPSRRVVQEQGLSERLPTVWESEAGPPWLHDCGGAGVMD